MHLITRKRLAVFWASYPAAETPLRTWAKMVELARWTGPADVKAQFGSVDFVGDRRAIFNIGGNKFRLVVHIAYQVGTVLVKFIGTHREYDQIDPETVE